MACSCLQVPVALAGATPRAVVSKSLEELELRSLFTTVITAEDSSQPESEIYYMYASQDIGRPPARCAVVGATNRSIEAAHELGMKSVIVSGSRPMYDFNGADLVVKRLDQLSFMNLKNLFSSEDLVGPQVRPCHRRLCLALIVQMVPSARR
jgi:5-amino-6-(5-phospho-D-ribitylamino)uracil phosphatase